MKCYFINHFLEFKLDVNMTEIDLEKFFTGVAKTMKADFGMTKFGKHPTKKGEKREDVVRKFLRHNLPENFGIDEGEVFDSKGRISGHIDVIIFDKSKPVFSHNSVKFFPIETVYGVCEVKTFLDKGELKKSILNSKKVKEMVLTDSKGGIIWGKFHERVYCSIFAFDSSDKKTLSKNLNELYKKLKVPEEERVDLICVLDKFIFAEKASKYGWYIANDKWEKIKDMDTPVFLETKEKSLFWFLAMMQRGFNFTLNVTFDFLKYIKTSPKILEVVKKERKTPIMKKTPR